jgi:hypothetical protein
MEMGGSVLAEHAAFSSKARVLVRREKQYQTLRAFSAWWQQV